MSDPKFVMTRHFDAPKELVWRTWTDAELVQRWYGPGVETVIHEFNPTPGGLWLNEMKMSGNSMNQRMEFTEVSPPDRLVMLMSNADADWNVIASPMMENWPRTLLTTVDLVDADTGTDLTLTWEPHEASDVEKAAFEQAVPNLANGWGAGMDLIAEILAEMIG